MVWADVAGKRDPLQDTIDRLYGLPLDEFTPARDAAAKERRTEKDREGAETLKRLRKPNLVAWSLNRVRRAEADTVEELIGAGERLQEAQRQLVSGGERGLLRDASADERRLVGRVADLASAELGAAGHAADAGMQSKLFATLHAAAANAEVRALLADGRLVRDHELSDLGLGDGDALLAAPPAPTPRPQPAAKTPTAKTPTAKTPTAKAPTAKAPTAKRHKQKSAAGGRAHERKVRALADRLERARARGAEHVQQAEEARARARVAEHAAEEAERVADEAATELGRAEAEAKRAAAAAKKTATAAEKATAAAEKMADTARQAEDTVSALEADLSALTGDD